MINQSVSEHELEEFLNDYSDMRLQLFRSEVKCELFSRAINECVDEDTARRIFSRKVTLMFQHDKENV
jgi:hypothetical protein